MDSSSRSLFATTIVTALIVGGMAGAAASFLLPEVLRSTSFSFLRSPTSSSTNPVPSSPQEMGLRSLGGLLENDLTVAMVKRVSPGVISINISKETSGDPFFQFFSPQLRPSQPVNPNAPKEKRQIGGGSGFLVSADGLLITNKHVVVDTGAEYTVVTQDGKKYPAKVLALDPSLDLAMMKIEGKDFPFLELGDSDALTVGQTVIAIGNALAEFQNTVTKGVVSGIHRRIIAGNQSGAEVIEEAIQTDAAINFGNSGGPLLDLYGRVVGVNTAISQDGQALGFALPINVVKRSLESVKKTGRIVRAWLGVRYIQIDEDVAKRNSLSYIYGALILRGDTKLDLAVIPGSPADKAGLTENDIVLEVNGQKLDENHSLSSEISKHEVGETVTLKIVHQGKEKEVLIKLEERK